MTLDLFIAPKIMIFLDIANIANSNLVNHVNYVVDKKINMGCDNVKKIS